MSVDQTLGVKQRETVSETELRDTLKAAGLRITQPRIAALEVLHRGGHLSVERLLTEVQRSVQNTSFQTMYGVLEALCTAGLARKIELGRGLPALFEANHNDNHHHTVCQVCGYVEDTPCDTQLSPCVHLPANSDFAIDTAEVTFYGVCGSCQREAAIHAPKPTKAL